MPWQTFHRPDPSKCQEFVEAIDVLPDVLATASDSELAKVLRKICSKASELCREANNPTKPRIKHIRINEFVPKATTK